MKFKLLDTNLFYLPGTQDRFVHLASIGYRFQEFMCFIDLYTDHIYIEEITGGHLEQIVDNSLLDALEKFAAEFNLLRMRPWNQVLKNQKAILE